MNMECINRARNAMLAAILATGLMIPATGVAYAADDESDDTSTKVKDKLNNLFTEEAEDDNTPKKTESVYIFANADGSVKNTVVSNWLKNATEAAKLHDISSLTDIENTEGKETFEARGQSLVWDAQGGDIYYQGKTDKQSPVSVKVTYWLDGKETPAADMAGKSGHVKIRFDYTNNSSSTEYVDGAARTVYTPFVCLTGLILDNGVFKNVKATHAKLINDGDRTMVGGYAMPGLKEDLDLDDDTLDIPTCFEIEADAENFEMSTTATIVTSDLFNNVNTDELNDDEISDALNELSDGMGQLLDGTSELYDGMKKLDDGGEKLAAGTAELQEKTADLPDSAEQLADGAAQLADGAGNLADGTAQLAAGSSDLAAGSSDLADGLGDAVDGTEQLIDGNEKISSGLDQLANGTDKATGLKDAVDGVNALKAGIDGDGTAENPGLTVGLQTISARLNSVLNGTSENPGGLNGAIALLQGVEIPDLSKAGEGLQAANGAAQEAATLSGTAKDAAAGAASDIQSAIDKLDASEDAEAIGLLQKAQAEAQGAAEAAGGAQQYDEGIQQGLAGVSIPDTSTLSAQLEALKSGLGNAADGLGAMETALDNKLIPGSQALSNGLDALNNGGTTADGRESKGLTGAVDAVNKQLATGNDQVTDGLKDLNTGLTSAKDGSDKLTSGANSLAAGAKQVDDGASQVSKGANTLADGLGQLNDAVPSLVAGITALKDGSAQLSDGIGAATKGTKKLREGLETFNEEGIQKIIDAYNDNLAGLGDRLKATVEAGKAYNTFTGKADEMQGSVKFILETDAIEISED